MRMTAARVLIIAALSFCLTASAASQEPAPSGGTQQEQPQAAKPDQPSTGQPQSTAPQPTIIYVQPPAKSEAEAEEDRRERHEKAQLDRRLVDLTADLSDYTGGLYRATVALAVSTVALVIATIGLVVFARHQSRDMKASIAVTREIGEAQVRAYVSIKSVMFAVWGPWEHPHIRFVAVNTGQSPARNFVWNVTVQYLSGHSKKTKSFNEKWLTSAGIDIAAASDAPPDGAMLAEMSLNDFRKTIDRGRAVVVRVKISFRFTDVFERDQFGESYFDAIGPDPASTPVNANAPLKFSALNATAKYRDWDEPDKA